MSYLAIYCLVYTSVVKPAPINLAEFLLRFAYNQDGGGEWRRGSTRGTGRADQ